MKILPAPPQFTTPTPLPALQWEALRLISELEQFQQRKDPKDCLQSTLNTQSSFELGHNRYHKTDIDNETTIHIHNETMMTETCPSILSTPSSPTIQHSPPAIEHQPKRRNLIIQYLSSFEMNQMIEFKQFVAFQLIHMMATQYINDGLEVIMSTLKMISTLLMESWTKCQEQMSQIYHVMTFKALFHSLCVMKEYVVSYTNQCTRITPYLCRILPSPLSSDVTSVQQMCAIVLVGGTVLSLLLGVFFAVWCRYKKIINEYLHESVRSPQVSQVQAA